jgi:hypothetical protein
MTKKDAEAEPARARRPKKVRRPELLTMLLAVLTVTVITAVLMATTTLTR